MRTELITAIYSALSGYINVDIDRGQLRAEESESILELPLCLLRFRAVPFTSIANGIQRANVTITCTIALQPYQDTISISEEWPTAIEYLSQYPIGIVQRLSGLQGNSFTPIQRVDEDWSDEYPGFNIILINFSTSLIEEVPTGPTYTKILPGLKLDKTP